MAVLIWMDPELLAFLLPFYKIELGFIVHKNASIVPKSDISIDKMKSIIYQ
jgi:hypothetical protein